jgi:hypothetical protein
MRYKDNVIDKLGQLDATVNRTQFQINRGILEGATESLETLKEQIEKLREIVSLESDDFERQFAPRL